MPLCAGSTAYHYGVGASNGAGYGAWSDVVSATTQAAAAPKTQPPDAPTNVSATASGESRIDVSWTAPDGDVTGYEVQWSADGSGGWTAVDPAHKGTGTKHSETGLAAGTTRSCRVRAVNAGGSGDWSGLAAATTERPS